MWEPKVIGNLSVLLFLFHFLISWWFSKTLYFINNFKKTFMLKIHPYIVHTFKFSMFCDFVILIFSWGWKKNSLSLFFLKDMRVFNLSWDGCCNSISYMYQFFLPKLYHFLNTCALWTTFNWLFCARVGLESSLGPLIHQ